MKILKGLFIGVLDIVVFFLVFLFIISFPLGVIKDGVKDTLFVDSFNIKQGTGASEEILQQSFGEFFNYYFDEFCEDLLYGDKDDDVFSEDFIKYIKENEKFIEEKIGSDIPINMLDFFITDDIKNELNQTYENILNEVDNKLSAGEMFALKVFLFMIRLEFKVIVGAIIAILLLIIALLQWSYYKWVRTLGNILITSGISCISGGITAKKIFTSSNLSESIGKVFINNNPFVTSGLYSLIIGVLLFIIYQIIKFMVKKYLNKNVIN